MGKGLLLIPKFKRKNFCPGGVLPILLKVEALRHEQKASATQAESQLERGLLCSLLLPDSCSFFAGKCFEAKLATIMKNVWASSWVRW